MTRKMSRTYEHRIYARTNGTSHTTGGNEEMGINRQGGDEDAKAQTGDMLHGGPTARPRVSSYSLAANSTAAPALGPSQAFSASSAITTKATGPQQQTAARIATSTRSHSKLSSALQDAITNSSSPADATANRTTSPKLESPSGSINAGTMATSGSEVETTAPPNADQNSPKSDITKTLSLPISTADRGSLLQTPSFSFDPTPPLQEIGPPKPAAEATSAPTSVSTSDTRPQLPVTLVFRPIPGNGKQEPTTNAAAIISSTNPNGVAPLPTSLSLENVAEELPPRLESSLVRPQAETETALSSLPPLPSPISFEPSTVLMSTTESSRSTLVFSSSAGPSIQRAQQGTSVMSDPEILTSIEVRSTFFTSTLAATTLMSSPTIIPSVTAGASAPGRTQLTPLARMLLITFGVLGAITLLVAFGVVVVVRRNRERARANKKKQLEINFISGRRAGGQTQAVKQTTGDGSPQDKSFMTESEKAIVSRATSPNGEPAANDISAGTKIADAVNAFIAKSRRLTYKLGP